MFEEAASRSQTKPTPHELIWAWKTLRSDGELNAAFGFLATPPDWIRAQARAGDAEHIKVVCPRGVIFEINLRNELDLEQMRRLYKEKGWPRPRAFVRLEGPLAMRPIRGGRLGCSATSCTLITPAHEAIDEESASILFGVPPNQVAFHGERGEAIHIGCRSLNHAYTLASQRFERARKSRGGRVFSNFRVFHPKKNVDLEMIRQDAERGRDSVFGEIEEIEMIDLPWTIH